MTFETVRHIVEYWGWISLFCSCSLLIGWLGAKLIYPPLSECKHCGRLFDDWNETFVCPGCKMAAQKLHRPAREITTEYWRN